MVRTNRNARGLATARALERAAIALAARHGIGSITVDQICADVGVSQRTFFNHFDEKEDALLGLDLPRLDEDRVRAYLADASVGVLSGALGLVELPAELLREPQTALARMAVIASSPDLARRQAGRFAPVANEVERVIALKLLGIAGDEVTEQTVAASASAIAAMAAALLIQPRTMHQSTMSPTAGLPPLALDASTAVADRLRSLDWIWSRLL